MQRTDKKLAFVLLVGLILIANISFAQTSIVDLKFELTNIGQKDRSPRGGLGKIVPYEELAVIYRNIGLETALGRTIIVKWHIINYSPIKELYYEPYKAYHLFDITWFRKGLIAEYQGSSGKWISFASLPTGFNFKPHAIAIIHGVGDAEILISPTICFGGFCLRGGGERRGDYESIIINDVSREKYKYRIIGYPITKSVYLKKKDDSLKDRLLEMNGEIILGDSAITTDLARFWFPFDAYSFDFVYTAYYPTKLELTIENIEDLKLKTPKKYSFNIPTSHTDQSIRCELNRGNIFEDVFVDIVWKNIVLLFIPLIIWILGKEKINVKVRIVTYIVAAASLWFFLPHTKYISKFNAFNIVTFIVYCGIIFCVEIKQSNRKMIIQENKFTEK